MLRGFGIPQEVLRRLEHCGSRGGRREGSEAMPMLEKYFSKIPAGPKPEEMTRLNRNSLRRSRCDREQTQPFYLEVITGRITGTRTMRL